jgi:hypothetical protein
VRLGLWPEPVDLDRLIDPLEAVTAARLELQLAASTRLRVAAETITSDGPPSATIRTVPCMATPPTSSGVTSLSPVWMPTPTGSSISLRDDGARGVRSGNWMGEPAGLARECRHGRATRHLG